MPLDICEVEPIPGALDCLIDLAHQLDPEFADYLEACLQANQGIYDDYQSDEYVEGESDVEYEREIDPYLLSDAEIDPGYLIPSEPYPLYSDDVQRLLGAARALRPELADCLEQIILGGQEIDPQDDPYQDRESPEYEKIQRSYFRRSKQAKSRRSYLKPCLLKLINSFDPELAECLRDCY